MENVLSISVLPVGEKLLVVTGLLNWGILGREALLLRLGTWALFAFVNFFHGRLHFHLVGVNNLGLLFHIKSLSMVLGDCTLFRVLFLIV